MILRVFTATKVHCDIVTGAKRWRNVFERFLSQFEMHMRKKVCVTDVESLEVTAIYVTVTLWQHTSSEDEFQVTATAGTVVLF